MSKYVGHFTLIPTYALLLPTILYRYQNVLFEWNSIRLLPEPTRNRNYANAPQCNVIRTLPYLVTVYVCLLFVYINTWNVISSELCLRGMWVQIILGKGLQNWDTVKGPSCTKDWRKLAYTA